MSEKRLKASVVIGGLIDRSFQTVLTDSKKGFRQIGDAVKALKKDQTSLNTEMAKFKNEGKAIDHLSRRYSALGEAIRGAQTEARKLRSAEAFKGRMTRGNEQARFMAGRSAMGAVVGGGFLKSVINPASALQLEQTRLQTLGFQEKDKQAGFEFGRRLKTFGSSQIQNAEIMRDGLSIFGNLKEAQRTAPTIAKMNFALRTLLGQTEEEANRQAADAQRVIDARGGATSIEEFNRQSDFIQRATMASGGRVTGSQWRELIQHGGLAAKGMSNNALFYGEMPMIQEMGAPQVGTGETAIYNNLYQGKTTKRAIQTIDSLNLVADRSKVHYDKNGAAAQIGPGAIVGADIFRRSQFEWMMKVLIPALAKHGITSQKQITDTFGTIVTNSTGANLMANRYINRRQIERDLKLAAKADGIDQSYEKSKGTAKGQEMGIHAQLTNARLNLGQAIMPTYLSLLQKTNTALEKFNGFITDHPKLTRAMMIGTVAVTGALAVGVPLLFTAGAAMSLYGNITALSARKQALFAVAQTQATRATLMGTEAETAASMTRVGGWKRAGGAVVNTATTVASGIGSVVTKIRSLGVIGTVLTVLKSPFQLLRIVAMGALTGIGSALSVLLSPVGLLVGALVVGGLLIWRYWQPISAFFSGFADGVMSALAPMQPLFSSIKAWAAPVVTWFGNLLTPVNSTRESLDQAGSAGKRFGEVLGKGIKSAIEIISELIGKIEWVLSKGAAIGGFLWKGAHSLFGGDESSQGHEPLPPVPPVQSASARGGDTHMTNSFHITQQPGQSPQELMEAAKDQMWDRHPVKAPLLGDGLIGSAY